MIADLLTKLEDEKDEWIYKAIDRFDERFLRFDGQKYDGKETAESLIMEIKTVEQNMFKQRSLDIERIQMELETQVEGMVEDQRTLDNLDSTLDLLQKELAIYKGEEVALGEILLEKFQYSLDDKFTFDKKDQVVFKERKVSRLLDSYQMVEMEMVDFYQKQLSNIWVLLSRSMQNIDSTAKFDFNTDPPIIDLSLKHGRGLDQYLKPGNFEEDYQTVVKTLAKNSDIVYDYYLSQVNQFKQDSIEEIMRLWTRKNEHKRLAEENLIELQEKKEQKEARILELQDLLGRAKSEWEKDMLRPKVLDDILKEEFVQTVTGWQEKLFSENVSDEERWAYHQYCQIILKQAERIIGNEYF
jgi:hypothetical protein